MRNLVRLCLFACFLYFGWQYYWGKMHCLEYNKMGVCLERCDKWDGWDCVKIRKTNQKSKDVKF